MQLCLLSFSSFFGAEWGQIPFCARATLLYNQWRDPNAICCVFARGTCFNMLGTFSDHVNVLVCESGWVYFEWNDIKRYAFEMEKGLLLQMACVAEVFALSVNVSD